jgi:hypothetical protein
VAISAEGTGDRLPRLRRWLIPLAGAAGAGLLVSLVAGLGPARIAAQLHGLGSTLPLLLLITAGKYPLQAAGWRLVLPPKDRPSWGESVAATIAGDALGYLTWAGPFTGEPIRALLLRDSVAVTSGIAAGAMERAIYHATAGVMVWIVLFVVASATHPIALVAAGVGSVLMVAVLAVRLRSRIRAPRVLEDRLRAQEPASATNARRAGRIANFVQAALDLWRERRVALPAVALLCVAQHAVLVAEAYVILSALTGGTTLRTALVFEAVTKIVNTAGLVVPGRLGIAEGGSALLADALGFGASHGLSLALTRRIRALIWAGVGLLLVPAREARARASRPLTRPQNRSRT